VRSPYPTSRRGVMPRSKGSSRDGVKCCNILPESPCGKVIFLSTAFGCFHPCQMAITHPVPHREVWSAPRPCYTHYDNVNLDVNNFHRK
jgi:hypothetical protein